MKKLFTIPVIALFLFSCQESLEDTAERSLREYSEKNCPRFVHETIILDSCRFERDTKTIHYFYTFTGEMDNESMKDKHDAIRELLLNELRNETSTRTYKDAGYSFKYTYFLQKQRNKILSETVLTKEDYQ